MWKIRIGYGLGDYSLNIFWQGIALFLFYFLTEISDFSAYDAGLLISISILWDLLTDPLTGYFAERLKSKKPYLSLIKYSIGPLCIAFAVLFWVPVLLNNQSNKFLVMLVALLVFRTAYTFVSIPYSSLAIQLTNDTRERNKLAGVRMYCAFLGGLTVIAILSAAQANFRSMDAFLYATGLCALLALVVLFFFYKTMQKSLPELKDKKKHTIKFNELHTILLRNKAVTILTIMIACVTFSSTYIMSTILHIFEYSIQAPAYAGIAQAGFIGIALIGIPFWSWANEKHGKKATWLAGSIISCCGLVLLIFATSNVWLAIFTYVLLGFGTSIYGVSIWTMIPDTVEYGEYQTGKRLESSIVGIVSAIQKLTIAIASFSLGLLMEENGYSISETKNTQVFENIILIVPSVAIATFIISICASRFYPAYEKEHAQITTHLTERS